MNANHNIMNAEVHFSQIPKVEKQRSRFDRSSEHKTAYNASELIPFMVDEVLPGDTITGDFSHVTRMTTPIAPVMDEAFMDVYAFFVPCRLVWYHWREFWGENRQTHWEQPVEYTIPQITSPATTGWDVGSLADYMGIPTGVAGLSVNALPFRAYAKVCTDWFIDENLKDPVMYNMDDTTVAGINYDANTYDYTTDTQLGAKPFKVAKIHDYFTSALPEPQKGPDVGIPLAKDIPIMGYELEASEMPSNVTQDANMVGKKLGIGRVANDNYNVYDIENPTNWLATNKVTGITASLADATTATINQLRQAFAVQRFYEAQARGGSRYIEFLKNIFGVTSPDARQQRSEYLGGKRFPINMDQVLQTSSTDATSPQGNTAAFSCTINSDNLFTYSATEHGYLLVVGCIRTNHSYQQGIEKFWSRKKWTDFYVPQFANLGEMPILNKEIYAQGSSVVDADGKVIDEQVFGYQEAWADYRYKPNRISGKLRSQASGSLDLWHYGDYYTALPQLSSDWIDETDVNIYRTLAVQTEPQFISDTFIKATWTRIMPLYSVPGLLDHH